jgi:GxxExxY protein
MAMHPLYAKARKFTRNVIVGAIEVHKLKGAGLIESIYEKCLVWELHLRNFAVVSQRQVLIEYKGFTFEENLRFDILIEDCLLVEVKAVQAILPIHQAQLFSYMKLLDVPLGLLINFHEIKLTDGIRRMMLPGADD